MLLTTLIILTGLARPASEPGATGPTTEATLAAQRGQRGQAPRSKNPRAGGRRVLGDSDAPAKRRNKKDAGSQSKGLTLRANDPGDQIREWFVIADYDLNDWVSFREAHKSMAFDRLRYRMYDTDHDGRIRFSEFKAFHDDAIYRGGKFREPRPLSGKPAPPQRPPELLRNAYDLDLDGEIGLLELARILVDYGREDVPADVALTSLDANRDQRLGLLELVGLGGILHPIVLPLGEEGTETEGVPKPTTIIELFGAISLRNQGAGAAPTPPLIAGPVPHYRRLDINNDGFVSVSDLEGLLRPLQLRIRVHSVLSTLDRDGDGLLSLHEFETALTHFEQ
ncbi:MAG: Ca2+-binding EF-hand superfamily protein [Chlamydiales bacterium]|jgi:Ca2+-binding EF-hand superfamily protein